MTRYRNTKRVTQPCRISVNSSGVVSFFAPFNESFLQEFKNVFNHEDRHWNPDRKIWQIKQAGIAALVEILNKYYNKIEGLDALIESPFDVIKVTPDAPNEVVKVAAKTLRTKYHPDKITIGNYRDLFPEAQDVTQAKEMGTLMLQEIGEAEKLIYEIRKAEEEND